MTSTTSKDNKKVDTAVAVDADLEQDVAIGTQTEIVDLAYLRSTKFSVFYRSVLFQMILFGALSFVGPAMGDAITNLGGGGLSSPYLANLANSLNYVMGCVTTLIGGPLINKLGIKWSCMLAAIVFPLTGSAYYTSAKFGIQGYLLASQVIGGIGSGFLYVAETTAMLSYPPQDDRGFYLGIWSAMRNSGSVIGGAINFSTNSEASSAGGIAWSTYLIFVGFECTGVIWAFLLSQTKRVRRRDGTRVPMSDESITWRQEFAALGRQIATKKTWLVALPAFYSFFYGGTMGTYLSLHFSVRARALSSLLVPSLVIPMVIAYGRLLDMKRWSRGRRAWLAFIFWVVPQIACFIWVGIEYSKFGTSSTGLDYGKDTRRWAEAYLPYLLIFITGYWTQLSLYWMLGCLSTNMEGSSRVGGLFRAFETAGQAVSYGINSAAGVDPRAPLYVNCGVLVLTIPCMVLMIRMVSVSGAIDGPEHAAAQAADKKSASDIKAVD
ncbi:Putative major facilitator superfamily, MFS transporter superfamily [Septoria linicola]|uniref:Major facilitator superfamily, MFS transporter superfamily n=1 Tax=Septoria linicola TaxID=215465 RepID=A0A9Q9ELP0_9PEZI|nr:putative major facilitator superfamily, MFS transporter superfamily [Septoria linicola]USW54617.1 Putative major facilitator superfamily, MFS transporter superfamily [Septoria linicola]